MSSGKPRVLSNKTIKPKGVERVCNALLNEYGTSRLGNPRDPLDDLVFITLSNKTSPKVVERVYKQLKKTYPKWSYIPKVRKSKLQKIIRPAGLSIKKSRQIKTALRKIDRDFGVDYLARLKTMDDNDVENYLTSLPGISTKVAKCIMLFALNRKVLPVDVHVHRITRRLGWITKKRADQSHLLLEEIVPPGRRFAFHVNCILHGRAVCRPSDPLCENCSIRKYCNFYKEGLN